MDKILIKDAIVSENVYFIDNKNIDYHLKGRVKILNFEQFKIDKQDFKNTDKNIYAENKIGKLELEYTNLTLSEVHLISNYFNIIDSDSFKFKMIQDEDLMQAIANHFEKPICNVLEDTSKNFIPKIKMKFSIFYLLPDEDTEYSLEVENCEIEEL